MKELLKKILATGWLDHKLSCEVEDARYWRWGMSKERELLERSIELIDQYWDDSKVGYPRDADNRKLFYEIEELLAQSEHIPDVGNMVEPVAWKVIDGTHGGYMFSRIKPTEHTYKYNVVIPLYTSPPKREPLSDGEITKNTPKLIHIGERLAFYAGVKFAEKIHGIGGK
jgi:hypothetical protein